MSERARIWQRVSTKAQDEASQLPDCVGHCDACGYEYDLDKRYVVHGLSASKGKHQAMLDKVFADMAAGEYTVLVVWASDRIERRGALAALTLAESARKAGGRIEYVKEPHLNATNEMSDTMLALAGDMARQESKRKSERVIIKQNALRSAGSAVGRAAWGYEIVGRDGRKLFVPTEIGRTYIPQIFARITNGESLRTVAAWLDAEKVRTTNGKPWNEGYLGNRLIKNPVYYGQRRNAGQLETEGLVSYSTWLDANAKLASRAKPGRSTVVRDKAMLAPVCGNPECNATGSSCAEHSSRDGNCPDCLSKHPSPMYRVYGGYGAARKPYYRCTGSGPRRTGCGNMLPLSELDEIVTETMLSDHVNEHVEKVFIPGNDRSGEIGKLRQQAMDAYASGDKALFLKLDAKADELAALPSVAPHWEDKKTGITRGAHFAALDATGRREYISHQIVWAHKEADGLPIVTVKAREYDVAA